MDKPVGTWLLLIPCLLGLLLARSGDFWLYIVFVVGAFVMRAAGCVVNDIFDRKIDAKVERTKTRPIAAGEISVEQAIVFLFALLLVGLLLLLTLPLLVVKLGFLILPFILLYPLMKRITYWPQAFLGFTFNFGAIMAYAAATNSLSLEAVILYSGLVMWTLGYDTIYAHQDKTDDLQVGVKSTALRLGANTKIFAFICYTGFLLGLIVAAVLAGFVFGGLSIIFLIAASQVLMWQIVTLNLDDPQNCLVRFKANIWVGLLLAASLVLSLGGY